jgi:hypothetical protein
VALALFAATAARGDTPQTVTKPGTAASYAQAVQGVTNGVPLPTTPAANSTWDISDRVGRALGIVTIGAGAATIGKVDQGVAGASAWLVTGTGGTFPVTGTFWPTTAGAPGSFELSDGAAFYTGAKTGQFPSALVGGRFDINLGAIGAGLTFDVSDRAARLLGVLSTGANTIGAVTAPSAAPLALDASVTETHAVTGATAATKSELAGGLDPLGLQRPIALDGLGNLKTLEEPQVRQLLEQIVRLESVMVLLLQQLKDPGASNRIDGLDDALRGTQ